MSFVPNASRVAAAAAVLAAQGQNQASNQAQLPLSQQAQTRASQQQNRRAPISQTGTEKQKETTYLWLNPVLCIPTIDPEVEEGFTRTPLPYGLAIDTMNAMEEKGSDSYLETVVQPRNAYLAKLVEFGFSMAPGETRLLTPVDFDPENPVPVIALELRRINERVVKPASSNNIVQMISGLAFA